MGNDSASETWTQVGLMMSEVGKAKEKLELPADCQVHSCYEAGRDGFWLHRELVKRGVDNLVVDPSAIEMNRRMRQVKTDRVDGRARGAAGTLPAR